MLETSAIETNSYITPIFLIFSCHDFTSWIRRFFGQPLLISLLGQWNRDEQVAEWTLSHNSWYAAGCFTEQQKRGKHYFVTCREFRVQIVC